MRPNLAREDAGDVLVVGLGESGHEIIAGSGQSEVWPCQRNGDPVLIGFPVYGNLYVVMLQKQNSSN